MDRSVRFIVWGYFLIGLFSWLPAQASAGSIPTLPDALSFCGQGVPLEKPFVREQFDGMFTMMTQTNRGQSILWFKRADRLLPVVKKMLSDAKLPEDLAYVMVAESDLQPRALSKVKAYGFWQFMPGTGKDYGLAMHAGWDERGDLVKSTMAAGKLLKELYSDFGNDWFLALAAYNNGKKNVRDMLAAQQTDNFWDAVSNSETALYVPRIVLIKALFENPAKFGIDISTFDKYPVIPTDRVSFELQESTSFAYLCKMTGLDYRTMFYLNPQIDRPSYTRDAILEKGRTYHLVIPKERVARFRQEFTASKRGSLI